MALKVTRAKIVDTKEIVTLTKFLNLDEKKDKSITGGIVCASCNARLKYTHSYPRTNGTFVNHFFSLSPKSRHQDTCEHSFELAWKSTIDNAKSNGVIEDFLENTTKEILFKIPALNKATNKNNSSNNEGGTSNKRTVTSSREAILKTASDFAKLWYQLENTEDKELFKSRIKIIRGNKVEIGWDDFVFTDDDLERLWNNQSNDPVAFILTSKKSKKRQKQKSNFTNETQCYSCITKKDNLENNKVLQRIIIPRIYHNFKLEDKEVYLLIANYKFFDEPTIEQDSDDENIMNEYINLSIFINYSSQIVKLD